MDIEESRAISKTPYLIEVVVLLWRADRSLAQDPRRFDLPELLTVPHRRNLLCPPVATGRISLVANAFCRRNSQR